MHSQTNPEIKSHHCSASTLQSILSWKCLYHITRWCDGQMTKHLNWLLLTWRSSSYTPSLILITKLLTISLRLETRYPLKEAHYHHVYHGKLAVEKSVELLLCKTFCFYSTTIIVFMRNVDKCVYSSVFRSLTVALWHLHEKLLNWL